MKRLIVLLFCFFSIYSNAQVEVQGKLLLEDFSTTKISILNKNSKEIIETDWYGVFKMKMKENDTLVFYQNDTFFDELTIPKHVIESKAMRYFLKKDGFKLEELVIDKAPMFNFGGKKLSKVEKIEHQNATKLVENNSIGISTDGIFNRIFGRTKTIKKVISLENSERDFKEFKFIYSDEILIKKFKIPADQVNTFVYYVIDSEGFDYRAVSLDEKYELFLHDKAKDFKKEYEL